MQRAVQSDRGNQQNSSTALNDRRSSGGKETVSSRLRAAAPQTAARHGSLTQLAGMMNGSPRVQALAQLRDDIQAPAHARDSDIYAAPVLQRAKSESATIQFGKGKRSKRKKPKGQAERYASCEFTSDDPVKTKAVAFFGRPPSNSRRGQGDHIVAYSLIQDAIAAAAAHKTLDAAGSGLAALITDSKAFVKDAAANKWWHTAADGLIAKLNGIDPTDDSAKGTLRGGLNDTAALLNLMPGTAMKNPSSSGGHGESSILHIEATVASGKKVEGNPWKNVLGLIDLSADSGLLDDEDKMEQKLHWMLTLVKRAAPTAIALLKAGKPPLMPDADLDQAVDEKVDALTGIGVQTTIRAWLEANV